MNWHFLNILQIRFWHRSEFDFDTSIQELETDFVWKVTATELSLFLFDQTIFYVKQIKIVVNQLLSAKEHDEALEFHKIELEIYQNTTLDADKD